MAVDLSGGGFRSISAATTNGKVPPPPPPLQIHKERYIVVEGGCQARVLPRYKRRRRKGGRERGAAAAAAEGDGDPEAVRTPQGHSQVTEEDEEEPEEEMKPLISITVKDLDGARDHQPTTQHNDDDNDSTRTPGRPFNLSSSASSSDHQLLLLRAADHLEENHKGQQQSTAEEAVEKPTEEQPIGKPGEDSQVQFVEKPGSPWPGSPVTAASSGGDDPEAAGPSKGQRRRESCLSCCRQFIAFLFSTVGSCCLLVAYTIFGGFVFQYLESQNEKLAREDMKVTRWKYVSMLWNITESFNVLYEHNWTAEADAVLESFTRHVFQATKRKGWDGTDRDVELQWSFPGALLYSITVVTTIGYGHIAPKTDWGKVATIFYAIFGIPLTLFTITNLGSIMATAFRFVYHYVVCGVCCVCCVARRRQRRTRRRRRSRWRENRKRLRAGETTTMMMMTTLDNNDDDDDDRGLRLMSSDPQKPNDEALEASADFEVEPPSLCAALSKAIRRPEDINKVRVPIYICLLLMLGYLALGTLVFRLSEDWDPLICLYFCFITLSTIGFGDYVPGTLDKLGSEEKMVLCALYLVFGLAVIAMCFDLIQEEAKNKLRHVGRRLGLLKKDDP